MKTEILKADHPIALHHTADVLRNGGLAVFPSDTVYGLAAFPREDYLERLYVIKGANAANSIGILISEMAELKRVARTVTNLAMRLGKEFWPGPLTLVVDRHPRFPQILSTDDVIGVRIPDHAFLLQLLRRTGPLAVTIANLSGSENPYSAEDALAQLNGRIHLVIDGGRIPENEPSTVIDCRDEEPILLRPGPVTPEDIQAAIA
jgi:L-threonylcarbamoyladenylate synthase